VTSNTRLSGEIVALVVPILAGHTALSHQSRSSDARAFHLLLQQLKSEQPGWPASDPFREARSTIANCRH